MKSFSEFQNLNEKVTGQLPDPPMILVLRRTAIRIFPSGEKVALYRNENLGIDISIPYKPNDIGSRVAVSSIKEDFKIGDKVKFKSEFKHLYKHYYGGEGTHVVHEPPITRSSEGEIVGIRHPNTSDRHHGKQHITIPTHHIIKEENLEEGKLTHFTSSYGKWRGRMIDLGVHRFKAENSAFGSPRLHAHNKQGKVIGTWDGQVFKHFGGGKGYVKEENLEEAALHTLHHITKTKTPKEVVFKNGARKAVDHQTAANVMKLHSKLNGANKSKIENLINTPEGLSKVSQFAKSNLE